MRASEWKQRQQSAPVIPVKTGIQKSEPVTQSAKDRLFYAANLAGEECLCGKEKLRANSFCYGCYKSLPDEMKKALYRGIGHGYEAAFEAAHKYLTENEW